MIISEVKHLASYNWTDSINPTILVPGIPNLWRSPKQALRLKQDCGLVSISQNAYRMPERPMEPLFRALLLQNPGFELHGVDIVTDRNNLRKLLSFVRKQEKEAFTIRLELVRNTLMMSREEAKTFEVIKPDEFRDFGHEFEKAYTKNKFSKSTGHHRIITYKLGGVKILLRHETDGYIGDDSVESLLESLSLDTTRHPLTFDDSNLLVQQQGDNVPISSTLEIKTRVSHKSISFEDIAPQLWLSQTPNLVRAYHQRGLFDSCEPQNVKADIDLWEREHRKDISKLEHLLRKVRVLVQQTGMNVLRFDTAKDSLTLTKLEQTKMLTNDLYAEWPSDAPENPVIERLEPGTKITLVVGGVEHRMDVSGIPYLNSLPRTSGEIVHGKIEYFDIAVKGLQTGYRKCFQMMTTEIQDHIKLIETYKLLQIDLLRGTTQFEVVKMLKTEYGDGKAVPQDAAYKLLFLMYTTRSFADAKALNNIFNAVFFIISHPRTFKGRTRIVIKTAFDEWFHATIKQQAQLQKWQKFFDPGKCHDVGESTDGESFEEFYGSDSFSWYSDSS
ncbi:MAG: hypothetical protein GOMPHAMPRED_004219 [Gomphillus americanus]|uniref:Uncharacterized protein n=1 Tax=Gomphillus americanus TaxID=1940652 RepID=A0A8H3FLK2_9LECA|nr:MAG: hypothetical protein GOMPHAMPRED_004219 [Gomphillus americanus]